MCYSLFILYWIKQILVTRMASFIFLTFSKRWGIECVSFVNMYSPRSHFSRQSWVTFSACPVFSGLDLCMLSHQWHSRCSDQVSLLLQWFFWYNVWQILLTPSLSRFWSVCCFICLKAFHPLLVWIIISVPLCSKINFDIVKFVF